MADRKKCMKCKAVIYVLSGFCAKCHRETYKDTNPVVYGEKPQQKA